jgi:hypothetical protein
MKHKIIILNNLRTMSKKLASIFLFIAATLTAISFTSCDREEEYQSGSKQKTIVGKWYNNNYGTITELTINSDGTIYYIVYEESNGYIYGEGYSVYKYDSKNNRYDIYHYEMDGSLSSTSYEVIELRNDKLIEIPLTMGEEYIKEYIRKTETGNKPTNNNISLTGQWIQINIDESERFPMKTYYTFYTDGTCAEDLYIKIGNSYSKNSRTEYTYSYNKTNSLLTLINLDRLDAQGNLIYKYATLSMKGNILNFSWTDGRKEQYTKQ